MTEEEFQGRLHWAHTSAFNEGQRWLVGELRKLANARDLIRDRETLAAAANELDKLIVDDVRRSRYAVYLDHFEAAAKRESATLAPSTLEERVSAAAGTMDATPAGAEGPRLLSIREHIAECDKLLSWDEPAGPQEQVG